MVIENLQIAPLAEWLLGAGWQNGWLWHPLGIGVLLAILVGGGCALVISLRRGSGPPGPTLSLWTGAILGVFSLGVLAILVMLSSPLTRNWLQGGIGSWLFDRLSPMLGKETASTLAVQLPGELAPAGNWSSGALYTWLGASIGLSGLIYGCCWLIAVMRRGPLLGSQSCGRAVLEIAPDIARISPRRLLALSWLAVRESIRRRVVAVFVVFVVAVLFAALFMKSDSAHPSQLYVSVIMQWTVYLTMLFALVLSALSLPGDIRDRTLHTVVTKPVRKIEIVLGRLLGFTAVGTLLLAGIGLISYGFTVRSLRHTHVLTADMLHKEMLPDNRGYVLSGETSEAHGHRHRVTINEKGEWTVETRQDHTHELTIEHTGNGETVYKLGPPEGQFQARVPIYGKLSFIGQDGKPKDRGINVGDEWTYRSFIQGQSAARAIWTFSDLRKEMFPEDQFPQGIPVEMTIEVFRTWKGNMEKGVPGTIFLENPQTHKRVTLENFAAEKFATDVHYLPLQFSRSGTDGKIERYDLFGDLVSDDGRLEVSLQCLENGQNFGMAQPDMYIRAADGTFEWNFVKAYFGIWLQMVLVLSLGLFFSTFVSGPVALLATVFVIIAGFCVGFVAELGTGKIIGGGPFESMQRIMTQDNMVSDLSPGLQSSVIKAMDQGAAVAMRFLSAVVPEFKECSFGRHLAYGFDVGRDLLLRCTIRELAFILPVILLGYLCLKQREIAQ